MNLFWHKESKNEIWFTKKWFNKNVTFFEELDDWTILRLIEFLSLVQGPKELDDIY